MARPTHRIVSHIYERGIDFPVVTHIFNGTSLKQAISFYRAHTQTDYFLKGCLSGRFKNIQCHEEHHAQALVNGSWLEIPITRSTSAEV